MVTGTNPCYWALLSHNCADMEILPNTNLISCEVPSNAVLLWTGSPTETSASKLFAGGTTLQWTHNHEKLLPCLTCRINSRYSACDIPVPHSLCVQRRHRSHSSACCFAVTDFPQTIHGEDLLAADIVPINNYWLQQSVQIHCTTTSPRQRLRAHVIGQWREEIIDPSK